MSNDMYSGGPSTDNYGIERPPRELPYEEEYRHDGPGYGNGRPAPERYRPSNVVRWIGVLLIAFVVLAVLCGGISAVLAAVSFSSTPATATVDKTFRVSGVPTLVIHGAAGSVHVNPGGDGQITVHVVKQVRALTHAQAQSDLNAINVTTSQSGNLVTIREDDSRDFGWHLFYSRAVDITVTVPSNTNLSVFEDAGSVDASGLTGKLIAQINAGNAELSNMTMATGSSLRVNAGSLSVDGALQPHASLLVEVNAGSADVTLPHDTSAHLTASASAGSVEVNGWNVSQNHDAAHVTVDGDLNPNPTGTITIRVSAGSASINAA